MTETPTPYTILDPSATPLLRLAQYPTTTVLHAYGPRGNEAIELDAATLQALLRALPRHTLLTALDLHKDCDACGVCQVCTGCDCPAEGLDAAPHYTPVWNRETQRYACQACGLQDWEHTQQETSGLGRCTVRPVAHQGAPPLPPCTALHAACPTCGAEAYPCGCITGTGDPCLPADLNAVPFMLDLGTLPEDAPLPIAIPLDAPPVPPVPPALARPDGWWRPLVGTVCVCKAQAGVHVATAACGVPHD